MIPFKYKILFALIFTMGANFSLFAQQDENWQKEVEYYRTIIDKERQSGITDTGSYLFALKTLSILYYEAEQYDSVIKYSLEAEALFRQLFFRDHSYHIFLSYNLADAFAKQKDYYNATFVQNELIRSLEKIYYAEGGKTIDEYEVKPQDIVDAYVVLSFFASEIPDAEMEKHALKKACASMVMENIVDSCDNAGYIYSQLSEIYYAADSIDEAIYYNLKVCDILKRKSGNESEDYLLAITNLAKKYYNANQFESAFKYLTEADSLLHVIYGDEKMSTFHISVISLLESTYEKLGDFKSATMCVERLIRYSEKAYNATGKTIDGYSITIPFIVDLYHSLHIESGFIPDKEKSKRAIQHAVRLMEDSNMVDSCKDADIIYGAMYVVFSEADSLEKALYYLKKRSYVYEKRLGHESKEYLDCLDAEANLLCLIGNYYKESQDYLSAYKMFCSSDSIYRILKEDTTESFFINMTSLIHCLLRMGAVPYALNFAEVVEPKIAYYLGECSTFHYHILLALEVSYISINDSNNANLIEQKIVKCNRSDAWAYYYKAILFERQGTLDSAEYYLWKSVEYYKKNKGDLYTEMYVPLSRLLRIYDKTEEIEKSDSVIHYLSRIFQANLDNPEMEAYYLQFSIVMAEIASKYMSKKAEDCWLEVLQLVIKTGYNKDKTLLDAAVKYVYESYANGNAPFHGMQDWLIAEYISQFSFNYSQLSKTERAFVTSDSLYQAIRDIVFSMTSDSSNLSNLYQYTLISKQQTLNTDIEFSRWNSDFGNEYLGDISKENNRYYERSMRVEAAIVEGHEWMMNSKYDTVIQCLNDNDIAVEYVRYWDYSNIAKDGFTTEKYIALVARKDWPEPRLILLNTADEVRSLVSQSPNFIYGGGYVSNEIKRLLFDPVAAYAKKGGRVYFSPDGILYNIALENILTDDGSTLGEKYNLIRCSSTRDIRRINEMPQYASAILYGGLDYGDGATLVAETVTRKGWNYLSGTYQEVSTIGKILKRNNVKTEIMSGKAGTEESFLQLSGMKTSILHLATHGFFYTASSARRESYFDNLTRTSFDNNIKDDSKDISPMHRSGLMLSGGNMTWIRECELDGAHDGVLLASEVMNVNLFGTELLVLSACETGLGDMSVEGIMGLQRAFKLAGVKTIVMSLWEVDDEATSLVMEQFYKNLMSGKSKREAFSLAQQKVRKKYLDEPQKWAAFIMLD